ncbi:hypothetical protein DEO72_LG10g1481 [Vigna unguiculata]|uniref:Uncharacterized protein n=1 Tax=Vigna unguiculata TaxID=3917 RepID=A0A4D6N8T6_VIGUN|nr:hypothetical protein DEO72_LG10g1481 [Vigna unguiculata]
MSSSDSMSTSSSSESTESERSKVRQLDGEELEETNWPAKGGYGWAAADVRDQSSLFRWSRLLISWLNCTPVISKGVSGDIVSLERVSAIDRSFKHFKDGYFKVVVKEGGEAYFLNADGSAKFSFSWTNNPSRYKDMGMDELSAGDKEVVETLLKFVDKLPTEGLVRVYNSVHPIIDIEGKAVGKTDVPNLQESMVEVHVHGGTKRKAELPPRPGKGKDVKKVRAALLGTGSASGAGSASGEKGPESGLIELPEISVRKDISITLPDTIVNSIDNMDAEHIVRTMVEFGSKALVLSRRRPCARHSVRLVLKFNRHLSVTTKSGMSSSDSMSTSSSSESTESERSKVRQLDGEELEETNWPAKGGYGWAAADVRDQSSLFRWSRLLISWLNCTPVISKGVSGDIVSLERVSAIDRSFKHFKDGYFKVVVKEGGEAYFLNADGSAKFSFSWTNNPSRYKDMGMDELSAGDKEVVETLLKFVDKLPTEGLSRKKNLALFQTLRKEMAAKARRLGRLMFPIYKNLWWRCTCTAGRKGRLSFRLDPGREKM